MLELFANRIYSTYVTTLSLRIRSPLLIISLALIGPSKSRSLIIRATLAARIRVVIARVLTMVRVVIIE
jgi:hypothetical protein